METPSRAYVLPDYDPDIELSRLFRQAVERIQSRMAAEQCGEAFRGIETLPPSPH